MRHLIAALLLTLSANTFAQDHILKMSGHEFEGKITEMSDFAIVMEVTKKNGKIKSLSFPRSDVFSIQKEGQEEEILYAKDEFIGDELTVQEMRIYIAGEQDALAGYDPRPTQYVGMLVGIGAGVYSQGGIILPLAVPVGYTLIQTLPTIKIREETIQNPSHKFNEIYALGYESVARSKKVLGGLKGSAVGVAAGMVLYALVPR